MNSEPTFKQEIEIINSELGKSLLKLQNLLEKKRRALDEANLLDERGEKELIETTILQIERKIRQIKTIGLAPAKTNR